MLSSSSKRGLEEGDFEVEKKIKIPTAPVETSDITYVNYIGGFSSFYSFEIRESVEFPIQRLLIVGEVHCQLNNVLNCNQAIREDPSYMTSDEFLRNILNNIPTGECIDIFLEVYNEVNAIIRADRRMAYHEIYPTLRLGKDSGLCEKLISPMTMFQQTISNFIDSPSIRVHDLDYSRCRFSNACLYEEAVEVRGPPTQEEFALFVDFLFTESLLPRSYYFSQKKDLEEYRELIRKQLRKCYLDTEMLHVVIKESYTKMPLHVWLMDIYTICRIFKTGQARESLQYYLWSKGRPSMTRNLVAKGSLESIRALLETDYQFKGYGQFVRKYTKEELDDIEEGEEDQRYWVTQSPDTCKIMTPRNIICYTGRDHSLNLFTIIRRINFHLETPLVVSREIQHPSQGKLDSNVEETDLCVQDLNNYAFWAIHNRTIFTSPIDYTRREIPPLPMMMQPTRAFHGVLEFEHADEEPPRESIMRLKVVYRDQDGWSKTITYPKVKRSSNVKGILTTFAQKISKPLLNLQFLFESTPIDLDSLWYQVPNLRDQGIITAVNVVTTKRGGRNKRKTKRREKKKSRRGKHKRKPNFYTPKKIL